MILLKSLFNSILNSQEIYIYYFSIIAILLREIVCLLHFYFYSYLPLNLNLTYELFKIETKNIYFFYTFFSLPFFFFFLKKMSNHKNRKKIRNFLNFKFYICYTFLLYHFVVYKMKSKKIILFIFKFYKKLLIV